MKMIKRLTAVAVVSGAMLAATPAAAANPVGVTGALPKAKATILKALTLTKGPDLDFGRVVVPSGVTGNVKVDQAGGLTCTGGLICAQTAVSVASFTVTGSNNQTVQINAPKVTMSNGTTNIDVTLDAPASVQLANSGSTGVTFKVGGNFNIDAATTDGTYAGDMNVTVEYL